ncbi:hypothetical protein LCGC14_3014700, partial [marine sediment metagenome]
LRLLESLRALSARRSMRWYNTLDQTEREKIATRDGQLGEFVIHDRKSRILAIHSGALGDCILFGRVLRRLGRAVTLVAGGPKAELLKGLNQVQAAIDFDALPMYEVFSDTPVQGCSLPDLLGPADRLISCFATGNETAERRLAGMCGAADTTYLPIRPPKSFDGHLVEFWGDLLGVSVDTSPLESGVWEVPLPWRQSGRRELRNSGIDPGGGYFVLHPGAGGEAKCWPMERYVELARSLRGAMRSRPKAVFVLGPAECERWSERKIESLRAEFAVVGNPSLSVLAGILDAAGGFVGNDSGPSHLAAVVGTPTVVLFGPTSAKHFRPLGPNVNVIEAGTMQLIAVEHALRILLNLRLLE